MTSWPHKIDHVAIRVTDIGVAIRFYSAALAPVGIGLISASDQHAAFDIGRYGWHKSIWGPPLQKTLPGLLKENGHATASVGKWHLGFGREGELVR